MRRILAATSMALGLLVTAVPAAYADHDRRCTQVHVHFRPTYCYSGHDNYTWMWICPDYYGGCFEISGPIDTDLGNG